MTFSLTTGMPEQPNTCLTCGCNPTNPDGSQMQAVFAEGVDIDWGNSVYICWECANLIADLMGRVPRAFSDKTEEELDELHKEHSELVEQHAQLQALVDKIREGGAAQRTIRAGAAA